MRPRHIPSRRRRYRCRHRSLSQQRRKSDLSKPTSGVLQHRTTRRRQEKLIAAHVQSPKVLTPVAGASSHRSRSPRNQQPEPLLNPQTREVSYLILIRKRTHPHMPGTDSISRRKSSPAVPSPGQLPAFTSKVANHLWKNKESPKSGTSNPAHDALGSTALRTGKQSQV